MKIIKRKDKKSVHVLSFSGIGTKTKEVAKLSSSFLLYPKLIAFLFATFFVLLVARVYFSNQLAVSGGLVSINEDKLSQLSKENYEIENRLSELSSLSYIESKAVQLGMVKVTKMEVLKNGSVALKE